jgi:hypothetical protein
MNDDALLCLFIFGQCSIFVSNWLAWSMSKANTSVASSKLLMADLCFGDEASLLDWEA